MECEYKYFHILPFLFYSNVVFYLLVKHNYHLFYYNELFFNIYIRFNQIIYLLKLLWKRHLSNVNSFLLRVTTPSSLMMLGWSNCPIIDASARKSRLCLSVYPPFRVLMATQISFLLGSFRRPLHTSPNSPEDKSNKNASKHNQSENVLIK